MKPVDFGTAAHTDIAEAYGWYEEQSPGLGLEFIIALDAAVASIEAFPEAHPLAHRGARRAVLERFPFCLYYRVEATRSVVLACVHAARDPEYWRSRLDG